MAKPTYYELLTHPKWQQKRLEILQRAGFACENCGGNEKTLHVHHSYYEKGLKPWEYPDQSLHALCVGCHEDAQDRMKSLHRQIGRLGSAELERLYGFALGLETKFTPSLVVETTSFECAEGIGAVWGIDVEIVLNALRERSVDGYTLYFIKYGKNLERE